MRTTTLSLAALMCGLAIGACADQEPAEEMEPAEEPAMTEEPAEMEPAPSLDVYAGTWNAVTYLESGDTVEYTMTATADTSGWMIDLPDRDPMPMRIVSAAGDSVVTEIGPYESILREGIMVTVTSVTRVQGDQMSGSMDAHYSGVETDTVVHGRIEGTRGM